jgi:uncharacterized protein
MEKIVIAGGTGFIGNYIAHRFRDLGYRVLIVSRGSGYVSWDEKSLTEAIEGALLVINLSGKTINCRHTDENKKEIIASRVTSTRLIGQAIRNCRRAPGLWVNASATGIYPEVCGRAVDETETRLGDGFLVDVVQCWEAAFFEFELTETRQIALRTSVVLGYDGGALQPLALLTKFGLGGRQGSGKQMFSWIHIGDYFRILLFLLQNTSLNGVFNCTSPTPVSNNELMYTIRKTLHRGFGLPAPALAVELGARMIGTESSLILSGSNVVPKRLLEVGFHFFFPTLDIALIDLLRGR